MEQVRRADAALRRPLRPPVRLLEEIAARIEMKQIEEDLGDDRGGDGPDAVAAVANLLHRVVPQRVVARRDVADAETPSDGLARRQAEPQAALEVELRKAIGSALLAVQSFGAGGHAQGP